MAAQIILDDREFLQNLRDAAEERATKIPNETWQRAYLHLADAADHLDAMEARTIDRED